MSHSKISRKSAQNVSTPRQPAGSSLAPDECRVSAGLIESIVRDQMDPVTPYEQWRSREIAAIEREIHVNRDRKNALLSSASRAALSRLLARRADEPAIAGLGEPYEVARAWIDGSSDLRASTEAALEQAGIFVKEMAAEAYAAQAFALAEFSREAGQLERRRRLLMKDFEELMALRVLKTARPIGEA